MIKSFHHPTLRAFPDHSISKLLRGDRDIRGVIHCLDQSLKFAGGGRWDGPAGVNPHAAPHAQPKMETSGLSMSEAPTPMQVWSGSEITPTTPEKNGLSGTPPRSAKSRRGQLKKGGSQIHKKGLLPASSLSPPNELSAGW
jgi:hypothetical protein